MLIEVMSEFLEMAFNAEAVQGVGSAVAQVAMALGYRVSVLVDARKAKGSFADAVLYAPEVRKEITTFDRRHPFADHPVAAYAAANDAPLTAEELRRRLGAPRDVWVAQLPPHSRDQELLLLPVHRNGELVMLAGCVGVGPDLSPLARAALHSCAHIAYDRIRTLEELHAREAVLSKREAECLHWASRGKTDAETGDILGIAPRTVRFHIANAKQKLSVGTRMQAIAKKARRLDA